MTGTRLARLGRRWLFLLVALVVGVGASVAAADAASGSRTVGAKPTSSRPAPSTSPSDRLAAADELLVGHYEAGRTEAVDKLPVVLLVTPGLVTAYHQGRSTPYIVPAQSSVDLKACAHAMLGFYGVMQPVAAGDRSAAQWARVRSYRNLIARMPAIVLHDSTIPPRPARWAVQLLDRLERDTNRAIRRGSETHAQLIRDMRTVRPVVDRIVAWSGKTYAAAFLTTLRTVRRDVGEAAWKRAWAVVGASPAATRDNLETGIMMKALGRSALGHRLFVSQNQFDTPSLLASVSGLYYDQTLARVLFGDPFRMWRDLFAPVTLHLIGAGFYPQPATRAAAGHLPTARSH